MGHVFIKKYNWNKKDRKTLLKSIQNNYSIQSGQFYNPIYALYIYYYNTRNAHKLIDINRHNRLLCLCTCKEHKHYNSNYLATAKVMNIHNSINIKEVFIKNMPLLDPINHIMGNYQKNLTILPSNYIHNTTSKLNSMENSSYVENIFPSFPAKPAYGSFILFRISDAFTRSTCVLILTMTTTQISVFN